jgi:hypothetical protein
MSIAFRWERRSALIVAVVGLALTLAVFAMAIQARSISRKTVGSPGRPLSVARIDVTDVSGFQIRPHCRPKYGCGHGAQAAP